MVKVVTVIVERPTTKILLHTQPIVHSSSCIQRVPGTPGSFSLSLCSPGRHKILTSTPFSCCLLYSAPLFTKGNEPKENINVASNYYFPIIFGELVGLCVCECNTFFYIY